MFDGSVFDTAIVEVTLDKRNLQPPIFKQTVYSNAVTIEEGDIVNPNEPIITVSSCLFNHSYYSKYYKYK